MHRWSTDRAAELDQIDEAHKALGGTSRGRRYALDQINYAYATLISSHFQGFCRDLHSECVDHVVTAVAVELQVMMRTLLVTGRKLDHGNPTPGSIGSDFGRFGIQFWPAVHQDFHRNDRRQAMLEELNRWRNPIAHQDFDPAMLGSTTLHLSRVRQWRRSINQLAVSFDNVMRDHIAALIHAQPW
jgi:hypothetical protein